MTTPGLRIPTWAFFVGLALCLAGIGLLVYRAAGHAAAYEAQWHNLPGDPIGGIQYTGQVEPARLAQALGDTVQDLSTVPGWLAGDVRIALHGYRIRVRPELRWQNYARQWVGAEAQVDLRTMSVNPLLNGLAHESAHVLEDRFFGAIDYGHAQWEARGIRAAVSRYEAKWGEAMAQ